MITVLFRAPIKGVGWVALECWPDGIKLRIRGHYVFEEKPPIVARHPPELTVVASRDSSAQGAPPE